MNKQRPRSRKLDTWPRRFQELVEQALKEEVCIPFETEEKLHAFQGMLIGYRRSVREWKHPRASEIMAVIGSVHDTVDVCAQRGGYAVDICIFPFTLILEAEGGFGTNLHRAVVPTAPTSYPSYYPTEEFISEESMSTQDDEYDALLSRGGEDFSGL